MHLSLSHSLECRQSLDIGLEHSQAITEMVANIRSASGSDPGNIIQGILDKVIASIERPDLREAIRQLCTDTLQKKLVTWADVLAVLTREKIKQFTIEYMFYSMTENGEFVHCKDADGRALLDRPKTNLPLFTEAFLAPDALRQRAADYLQVLQANAEKVGSVAEYSEMITAQNIMEIVRPHIDILYTTLVYLFAKKDLKGEAILATFLRDSAILQKLTLILSERMLKRFVKRFEKVGKKAAASEYEDMILNTVAEYTLISMGIITPDIFTQRRGDIDTDAYTEASADLEKIGVKLEDVLSHYHLKSSGSLFWCRYSTTKTVPSRISDEFIRHFITETVRKDRVEVFEALNYSSFFNEIKKLKWESEGDIDVFADGAINLLREAFSDNDFQIKFLVILRRWYVHLETLL